MPEELLKRAVTRAFSPRTAAPPVARRDVLLAVGLGLLQTAVVFLAPPSDGRMPGLLGWTLLTGTAVVVVFRRRAPWLTLVAAVLLVGPYHSLDFSHSAAVPAALVALFSMAAAGPPLRTFATLGLILGLMATIMASVGEGHQVGDMARSSGWLVAFALVGEALRLHRDYVHAIVERAERAARTREEEAARRLAEERLRIARDLHDLLAHTITLIGVQTSVAAHVLVADPERLDRDAVAQALDGISDTCRGARSELRTTLEVLRADADGSPAYGPLPGLSGLPDLARSATAAGARVELTVAESVRDAAPPPVLGAAAYRIVQEAFTNAVRHAGASVGIRASVAVADGALRVLVEDDGGKPASPDVPESAAGPPDGGGRPGFGIAGMRERARSVGGTLEAAPRHGVPGFAVTASLPLAAPGR